jgi:predicted nucleic acid-binding protein
MPKMSEPCLVDTDILVDAARGVPAAIGCLSKLRAGGNLSISAVNHMELLVGCRDKREQNKVERFVRAIEVVPLDAAISAKAVELLTRYRLSHGLLIADSLVAATAIQLGRPLATGNKRHFRFVDGLRLAQYP